ncbi:hypothetical protein HELRODRAFT_193193 [Helobdella robusta]|uniref:Methyltransferase domain-containing protein n=1 Tax=Helobdella robusta TaxID=6412 RepID=T1FUQ5_HELRO|nr:hypothetical protein HELRODRAFT_193193 [Helobdella robusta]ESN97762.1 hypothetical protein HELRODRAFT_193193 [Helobdella robusta]
MESDLDLNHTSSSYVEALDEFRKVGDVYQVYNKMYDQVKNLDHVTHVIAIGAGPAIDEIAFMKKLTPYLSRFTAVDMNEWCMEELRQSVKKYLPSDVILDVHLTKLQDWQGPSEAADLVFMFHSLYYFNDDERKNIYEACFKKWLKPNGKLFVKIIKDLHEAKAPHYLNDIYRETGRKLLTEAFTIKQELQNLGYKIDEELEYIYYQDLSILNNSVVSFIKLEAKPSFDDDETVRNVLKKLHAEGNKGYSSGALFSVVNEKF